MRTIQFIFTLLILVTCVGGLQTVSAEEVTYQNPIGDMTNIGDPFILKDEGTYYMYATSNPSIGFTVWTSKNLVDWEEHGLAYDHINSKLWAMGDFWAPEVIKHNDLYYMSYSARDQQGSLRIAIATSDSPTGPFVDANSDIIKEEGSYIDGHFFIDEDGIPYFYYVKDNYENVIEGKHVSHIYVQEMTDDLLNLKGDPIFLLGPDQEWEDLTGDYQWNEGPFVVKHDDLYYLMYSANFYGGPNYAIGYAVSEHPMGPYIKHKSNPILSSDLENGVSGPGHNSVTVGLDDVTLYAVYHVHTDVEKPGGDRRPALDVLYFDGDEMKVDGPTTTKQVLN